MNYITEQYGLTVLMYSICPALYFTLKPFHTPDITYTQKKKPQPKYIKAQKCMSQSAKLCLTLKLLTKFVGKGKPKENVSNLSNYLLENQVCHLEEHDLHKYVRWFVVPENMCK